MGLVFGLIISCFILQSYPNVACCDFPLPVFVSFLPLSCVSFVNIFGIFCNFVYLSLCFPFTPSVCLFNSCPALFSVASGLPSVLYFSVAFSWTLLCLDFGFWTSALFQFIFICLKFFNLSACFLYFLFSFMECPLKQSVKSSLYIRWIWN